MRKREGIISPEALKVGLPKDPVERHREYQRRYGKWWRQQNPGYSAAHARNWRANEQRILHDRYTGLLVQFAVEAKPKITHAY
jgi:hypothetical protein